MRFDILQTPGLSGNFLKSGDREAVDRQTASEHEAALDITTLPDYPLYLQTRNPVLLEMLKAQAAQREADLAKYWDDEVPRRPVAQNSSFVQGIIEDPYTNNMTVLLDKGRTISYSGKTPKDVADILNSTSIGRSIFGK
jgi:hypothetical protein